ncbi:MAG: GDP-mannose dehydrogenase, partial [Flavobacteriaceae bacterium]|nr:GDP-mannose dehydrogenase [Flavobacteriaceae bacterium]
KILKNDNELVILSQVNPGFTRNVRVKAKNIYYQVETLVFGNAIDRALNPERITIGLKEKDRNLSKNFKVFLDSFKCPLIIMNYESAELTKISINLFLIAQVSVTNTVSSLCEKIGADWTDMVPSLKLDKRIGQYCYLKPGLGISGGNLERDMATIMEISSYKQIDNSLINTFIQNSHDRKKWVFENLKSVYPDLNKKLKISILGLSYKENTDSVKNSPSIETIKLIPNVSIYAYDPVVKWNVKWHNNATILNNLYDTLNDCDAMLIMTPWEEFKTINLKKVKKLMKGRLIIDPYCMLLNDKNVHRDFKYIYMGGSQNNKDLKNGNKLTKKLT